MTPRSGKPTRCGILPHSGRPGRVYRELARLGAEFERAGDVVAGITPDADIAPHLDVPEGQGRPRRLRGAVPHSDDEGETWTRINDDQHRWGRTGAAITGDPRVHGRVCLATNGRGVQYGKPA
ncbi:hypothetical protein [Streptomyces sp. DH10]|uniref:hypothetical protein n=1 Tax=Streptomyces sp. DH10 TaxID=3040121 RepID=UPI002442F40D|nr:hypothetical protein [Streptomyces sp. DH10]MDG9711293.1 hypothetical protein [Streptomyces sp. DH10]